MTGMRRVGAVISKHGATVIAFHEHLMLLIAAHIGHQCTDGVIWGSARRIDYCIDCLGGHAGIRGRASERSYSRGYGDQEGGFRHLVVSLLCSVEKCN